MRAFRARAARREARHPAAGVCQHTAVLVRLTVGHERHRDQRAGPLVRGCQRAEVDVGQRVAVDDEEGAGADDRQRVPRPARRCRAPPAAPTNIGRARRDRCRLRRAAVSVCGRWWRLRTRSVTPCRGEPPDDPPNERFAARRGSRASRGRDVSGRSRVPRPAVRTSAWRPSASVGVEQHVAGRQAALLAVPDEQPAIRFEHVVGGPAAERSRDAVDAALRRLRSRRTRRPAFRRWRRCSRRARTPRGTSGSETRRGIRALRGCCSSRWPSPTTVSSSSRTFMRAGCTGPLKVSRLRPPSMRTRSAERRRRRVFVRSCRAGSLPEAAGRGPESRRWPERPRARLRRSRIAA